MATAARLKIDLTKYASTILLRDGSSVRLRPIKPDDAERLKSLFHRLSNHSIYLRFHHVLRQLEQEEASRLANVDYHDSFALAATLGEGSEEKIIAVGRYARMPRRDTAEVAFAVEDRYQKKGIGTQILGKLADIARQNGIRFFCASLLPENEDMRKVLLESGYGAVETRENDMCTLTLDIAPTSVAEERSAERERAATIASLKSVLSPASIAVIGASRNENSIGNRLFRNILRDGFTGVAYPVNPNARVVASVKSYPSVMDIPDDVELAIVVVPAAIVNQVVEQCGHKGVKGIIVISAGFAETGPQGKEMQRKLQEIARSYGMRLVGPNCMGIINTHPDISMNATFSPVFPPGGKIGFCTQSGALGLAILDYAKALNMGLSTFVSIGDRADVSSNDLLQYWEEDQTTGVVLLYLESFGNPRRFARIARSISAKKPVVVVRAGRTAAGIRAAASHTGSLATTEVGAQALSRQAGIVQVNTLEELFDVATLMSHQPIPKGRKVAILTNGGGPGILTADACASKGLDLPSLSDNIASRLSKVLPSGSSVANPVDMTAEATAEHYYQALELLLQEEGLNTVIVLFIPPIVTQTEAVAKAIRSVAPKYRAQEKTLVASFIGQRGAAVNLGSPEQGYVPSFVFPEDTAGALASACEYGEWLQRPKGTIPALGGIDKDRAERAIRSAVGRANAPAWMGPEEIQELLSAYSISGVPWRAAASASEAGKAAEEIGFPVAVKLLSDTITHKTEVGGVVLDLNSRSAVESAFRQIRGRLASIGREIEMKGVMVQKMVPDAVEIIAGIAQDASFGPLMMFGMGGTYAELFKDVSFLLHPLTDADARDIVRSVKAYRVLEGWRGARPSDVKALEDLLLRLSAMVEDLPQIQELDLNPVKVFEEGKGYAVVDARVLIGL